MMVPTMMASIMVGAGSAVTAIPAVGQADSSIVFMAAGPGTALGGAGLMVIMAVTDIVAGVRNAVVLMVPGLITVFHTAEGIAGGGRICPVAVSMGKYG